jgi:uncharacterized protein (TIGR00730 family)
MKQKTKSARENLEAPLACAVFCASRTPNSERLRRAATLFGTHLAARNVDLLYGAVESGVMDLVARAVHDAGGRVIGFTTRTFHEMGLSPANLSRLHIAGTLSARKAAILKRADFAAVLPGGVGTLDELFEALALIETRAIHLPIGLLNAGRYYGPLLRQLASGERAGLVNPKTRRGLIVEARPAKLLDRLLAAADSPRT